MHPSQVNCCPLCGKNPAIYSVERGFFGHACNLVGKNIYWNGEGVIVNSLLAFSQKTNKRRALEIRRAEKANPPRQGA